ncbi:MAG: nucleotidyltransferase domain-containing protein [Paludibacteraceae bacterium]|nr:nucleotidyltransferase domain-containing protein [Paludibacteraceae bacterium]
MRRTQIVGQIAAGIHSLNPTAKLILFGSEARGDARPDSDIDLIVLLNQEQITTEEKDTIYSLLYDIELATLIPINAHIYTQTYWDNRPIDPFKINVQNEGILL